jgi:hypothetical protein
MTIFLKKQGEANMAKHKILYSDKHFPNLKFLIKVEILQTFPVPKFDILPGVRAVEGKWEMSLFNH